MDSTTKAALIAGVVSLVGVFVTLLRNNKQDRARYELLQKENEILKSSISVRHTLEKAHEYHELTMNELEKEFQFNKERITDVKGGVLQVSSAVGGVSTDIKLMSKDLENHVLNLKEVIHKEPDLAGALRIFEGYIQKLGEVQRDNTKLLQENLEQQVKLNKQMETIDKLNHDLKDMQTLQKETQELKKNYLSLKKDNALKDEKIKLLIKKNEELQKEIKDMEKDDLYHDEISL